MSQHLIYAASIKLKNGKVIYARDYGKKCFVFPAGKRRPRAS